MHCARPIPHGDSLYMVLRPHAYSQSCKPFSRTNNSNDCLPRLFFFFFFQNYQCYTVYIITIIYTSFSNLRPAS